MALGVKGRVDAWEGSGKGLTKITFGSEGDLQQIDELQEILRGYPAEVVVAVVEVLSRGLHALDPRKPYFPVENSPTVFVNRMEENVLAVVWPATLVMYIPTNLYGQ